MMDATKKPETADLAASVQPDNADAPPPVVIYNPSTEVDFEDVDVSATTNNPNAVLVTGVTFSCDEYKANNDVRSYKKCLAENQYDWERVSRNERLGTKLFSFGTVMGVQERTGYARYGVSVGGQYVGPFSGRTALDVGGEVGLSVEWGSKDEEAEGEASGVLSHASAFVGTAVEFDSYGSTFHFLIGPTIENGTLSGVQPYVEGRFGFSTYLASGEGERPLPVARVFPFVGAGINPVTGETMARFSLSVLMGDGFDYDPR